VTTVTQEASKALASNFQINFMVFDSLMDFER